MIGKGGGGKVDEGGGRVIKEKGVWGLKEFRKLDFGNRGKGKKIGGI
ncbi:hypothetical protein [Siminovitchia fortis]|nr:hypothetical protein [Siminovitchia fortis]